MNGLQSSTRYVFRVAAANSLGIGQATSISVRTMGTCKSVHAQQTYLFSYIVHT